jgi:hypothetical protein
VGLAVLAEVLDDPDGPLLDDVDHLAQGGDQHDDDERRHDDADDAAGA